LIRRRLPDILIIALLFALPLVMFWQQTVGGYTLLPTENLYQFEPYATYREVAEAPALPHNALVSDLVLQNYQWKSFIRESLSKGEIPLWNPYQFSGIPFLAAGQQSTLYPFSIIYYVLPLTAAYGWFTVVQLWLAGVFMLFFARGLNIGRFGATISGVTYQLSAFFVISAVFPMIIGAAVWLPLLLLMIEFTIQQRPAWRGRPASIPWVMIGAVALGCNILAGHVEITYYTLLIMGYYGAARMVWELWKNRGVIIKAHSSTPISASGQAGISVSHRAPLQHVISRGVWLIVMVTLGIGLGAVQFVPLFELASKNFRAGSASFEQVIGWAHPLRDVIQFIIPNFYGSPAHHSYVDVFTWQNIPATVNALGQPINTIDWGIKNYVEGALYLGILPLLLAAYALVDMRILRHDNSRAQGFAPLQPPYRSIFALLALFGLTFMFGLPTYRLLYLLPGIDQLHSPFRWIFAVTLAVAALAGFGADALTKTNQPNDVGAHSRAPWTKRIGLALMFIGTLILIGTRISIFVYPQIESVVDRLFHTLAKAPEAFADARMFYSYEYTNIMTLGFFVLSAGAVFWLAGRNPSSPLARGRIKGWGSHFWQILSIGLIALDMMAASWGFNPASDPALLDFRPPAIEWLQRQPGYWRYATLDDPNQRPIMNANMGWRYDLYDIRGYESIIPKQYVDYMQQLAPQVQLEFNRIAPFYTPDDYNHFGGYHRTLDSPLFDLLNVRYVITHKNTSVNFQEWTLAYEDEAVRIWENGSMIPRAYLLPEDDETLFADPATLAVPRKPVRVPETFEPATITQDSGREKFVDVSITKPAWLIVSESYFPGWRAYIHPQDASDDQEAALEVQLVQGNFQGIHITTPGDWTVRLVYSPTSFQIGAFASFISAVLMLFMFGVWAWRLMVAPQEQEASAVSRVARNSLAPIILNLFNRGLDFAFAAVMFRILDPADAGLYQYAIVIFVWFDIFTNFGLNTFLTREVSRDRSRAGHYFFNTSIMRLVLIVIGVLPLVVFIGARQSLVAPPLNPEGLLALGLLYVGLLPNSLSTGMTAVFYAFERAEYPSAVSTIATINKVICGVAVLVLGYGIIGLAAVSIFTNFITLAVLVYGGRELISRDDSASRPYTLDWGLIRSMTRESWPLMLNHFLATIFFQIDIVLMESIHGSKMVAQYSVAYKWIAAINVIPAFFTMAMLPVMSRQAHEDPPALKRTYTLAVKLLVNIALPTAVLFTFTAYVLTTILGGAEYLPDGAIATQLMIWSIPIGWINSLTQYVLIALNLQRRITWAFIIAVTFNIVTNLIFIPQYGYRAAALTTIASEAMLLIPFGILLAGAVGQIDWLRIIWQPLVAGGIMFGVILIVWNAQPVLALVFGVLVYPTILLMLRPFSKDEIERLQPLLPARLRLR
jgi:O-antigen/teichoic acid export membrane protein